MSTEDDPNPELDKNADMPDRLSPAADGNSGSMQASSDAELIAPDDLIPAFAIGATDPEERDAINALLAEFPNAASELAEYAVLNQALLHSADFRQPSTGLRDRLKSAIQSEAPATDIRTRVRHPQRPWRRLATQWSWLTSAAAAVILLLVLTNIVSLLRINALQEYQQLLTEQLRRHDEVLAIMVSDGAQETKETILPAATEGSAAQATVRWQEDRAVAVLFADDFPVLEPDQVYQLWLVRDGQRQSGGLFTVDSNGFGTLVIQTDAPLSVYERMGITPEPAGGSPGPTGQAVVRGPV